jgi:hypothetical protein
MKPGRTGRPLAAALALALVAGCSTAPKPLYHWGEYQRMVYDSLNGDASPQEQLAQMQKQVDKAKEAGAALPPGFRAHLGLLYVKLGRYAEARQMMEEEKAAFPESAHYMDFVLKSMEGAKAK